MRIRERSRPTALADKPIRVMRTAIRRLQPVMMRLRDDPSLAADYLAMARQIARNAGLRGLLAHALRERDIRSGSLEYADWVRLYDTLSDTDRKMIARRIASFGEKPLISVIAPIHSTPETTLRRCIESVREQLYPHWEMFVVRESTSGDEASALAGQYRGMDERIRFVPGRANDDTAAAANTGLELASGGFVALLDHHDELAPHALYMLAEELNRNPGLDLVFSDEDTIDASGRRFDPYFKTDLNYDLMLSQNCMGRLAAYRRSMLREIGGFRSGFDGSEDYDVALRITERTVPERVKHIPFILYHRGAIPGAAVLAEGENTPSRATAAKAVQQHLDRACGGGRVEQASERGYFRVRWPLPSNPPHVTIIIPTKDKLELLRTAVDSVIDMTEYPNLDVLVVNNRSERDDTKDYLAKISGLKNVRVLAYDRPYSFAALNNWAVLQTDAPLLAFLNNDTKVISPSWLSEMVSHALRPGVGSVGAKLYYPNDTIQHAGVIVGLGGLAGHPHIRLPRGAPGYFGRAVCTQQFSAVSAACMVMRRDVFLSVGGFDDKNFAVAYNDVDIGLRLREAGYSVVWTPYAELFHLESASLGPPLGDQRRELFQKECENLRHRWAKVLENDPFYNLNLTIVSDDFSLAIPPRVKKPWAL
jgi:GT2 family glycosyltransferase